MANTRIRCDVIEINNLKTFCKVKMDMARQGRVMFSFVNFDKEKSTGSKVIAEATAYLTFEDAKLLAQDILSGKIAAVAKKEKERAAAKNEKYCKAVWINMGGTNEKKSADLKYRTDGMATSRVLSLTPGDKQPFILRIDQGAGQSNEKGLIVPKFGTNPDVRIMVAFDSDTLKKLALMLNTYIDGFIAAQFARGAFEEEIEGRKIA